MQKIISWNVASVRARLPALLSFLQQEQPDFMLLQEIKATEETFPYFDFQLAGYRAVISGQKGYNGVAILSKQPIQNSVHTLTGFEDQARFLQVNIDPKTVLICVYVPNGNPPEKDPADTSRLMYKLAWFRALKEHIQTLLDDGVSIVLGGDFNVIERDTDVYNPEVFRESSLMVPDVRHAYQELQNVGLINMVRRFYPEPNTYSFWDFQGGSWPKNRGILLDAILVSRDIEAHIVAAKIYRDIRGWSGTSDHVPVGITLVKEKL